jgi:hypothetical protein
MGFMIILIFHIINLMHYYNLKKLKSFQLASELAWIFKKPDNLISETGVNFGAEKIDYPVDSTLWENFPAMENYLKAAQSGRLKVSAPDVDYTEYFQRNYRQKYKVLFEDRYLVPKKIVQYMIQDMVGDRLVSRHYTNSG